jgi:hypothetical protein
MVETCSDHFKMYLLLLLKIYDYLFPVFTFFFITPVSFHVKLHNFLLSSNWTTLNNLVFERGYPCRYLIKTKFYLSQDAHADQDTHAYTQGCLKLLNKPTIRNNVVWCATKTGW